MNKLVVAALVGAMLATPAAAAEVIDARAALSEWNLITLGDYSSGSHVEGRVFVGGNMASSNAVYYGNQGASAKGTANVTVVGNTTGSFQINNRGGANFGGNVATAPGLNGVQTVQVGGTMPAVQNLNGSTVRTGLNASQPSFGQGLLAQKNALVSGMANLSANLKAMATTAGASYTRTGDAQNGVGNFTGVGTGLSVINIDGARLNEFSAVNLSAPGTLVINVSGKTINLAESFLQTDLGSHVLWNFYEAETLTIADRNFYGSILAAKANASLAGNATLDGVGVFGSLAQGTSQIHLARPGVTFTGDLTPPAVAPVPEPASWAMMIAGFGLVGTAMRRRSRIQRLARSV